MCFGIPEENERSLKLFPSEIFPVFACSCNSSYLYLTTLAQWMCIVFFLFFFFFLKLESEIPVLKMSGDFELLL